MRTVLMWEYEQASRLASSASFNDRLTMWITDGFTAQKSSVLPAKISTASAIARPVATMTRPFAKVVFGLVLTFLLGCESSRAQVIPGPQGPEEGVIRRQLWLIPAHDRVTIMRTSLYRPPGAGPFPLAVVNHGSTQNALQRAEYRLPDYSALAQWFVARGYAVAVPQRP